MAVGGNRSIIAKITYGDLKIELVAEGASWNPDIADDLIKRVKMMWRDSLESMLETNAWEAVDADDIDD